MSSTSRERSSSLFIISEGQFYSKPSIKLERLEKDYSDLKRKENHDEIELRRLRTENLLLKQRIDNLEKESATLADKLVQDKVAWAQEVEQMYAVRTRLSIALRQFRESQNQLHDSENIIEDLNKKNRICTDQIRRVAAENKKLKKLFEEITQDKKALQTHINTLTRKLDDYESIRKEEAISARIKDAEHTQQMAELRCKLAEIDIQQPVQFIVPGMCVHRAHQKMTDSQPAANSEVPADSGCAGNSDDEFDALIKDSENLERTLLDIIEGRRNFSTMTMRDAEEGALSNSRDVVFKSNISNTTWRQANMTAQVEAGTSISRKFAGDMVVGLRNDISDGKVLGIVNVDATPDDKVLGIANVDGRTDDKSVGIANGEATPDGKVVGIVNFDDTYVDKVIGTPNVDTTCNNTFAGIANVNATSDEKAVCMANVDERGEDNIVGVVNIVCADCTIVGEESVDGLFHENKAFVANAGCANDASEKITIGLACDDIAGDAIVGEAKTDDNRKDKIVIVANGICVDVTQCGSRFRRVGELEHDSVVDRSQGGAGAIMSLFGYKGEASLMLKESTI